MTKNQRSHLFALILSTSLIGASTHALETAQSTSSLSTQIQTVDVSASLSGPKKTTLNLTMGLLGKSLEDDYANSKYAGGSIGILGRHQLGDSLSARLNMTALLTSGTATNQYSSAGKAPNTFFINEAAVALKPVSFLTGEIGVIKTNFSTMPSTMDANGFPSLRETVQLGGEDFVTKFFAMQSIPTSDTVATQSTDEGKTTQLFIYGANFTSNARDLAPFTVSGSVMAFDFRNLNAAAATDSRMMGNTVTSSGTQARFLYQFAGNEASGEVSYRFAPSWKFALNGAYLVNNEAPTNNNKGYLYSGTLTAPAGQQDVSLAIGYFYNEPDTLPASYTSSGKGSNNRFGQVARLSVKNVREKVSGYLQYVQANTIETRPYMADRQVITMGLEIAYEIL